MAGIAGMSVVVGVAIGAVVWVDAAVARSPERLSSVTVCSRYGKGCVSGSVRPGKFGPDVRMPGGTWISCKLDCSNTLREETVDFWETKERDKPFGGFGRRRW